jgi:dienelactone hydrolase
LQAGVAYLKQLGRKLATIGFSMGGQESLNANLNDPGSGECNRNDLRVRL